MATLTNTKIKDTYDGLLKTTDNDVLDVSGVTLIEDGLGNASALSLGRVNNGVTITGALTADKVNGLTLSLGGGSVSTNVAIGFNSLRDNTTGTFNFALGSVSAFSNTTGGFNIAVSSNALFSNTTGSHNIALGNGSLRNITGSHNIAMGYLAGYAATGAINKTSGDNNIYIGTNTVSKEQDTDNEIVIGYAATGNGSNTATYGNNSITDHYFNGNVHIDGAAYIDAAIVDSNGDSGESGQILSSTVTGTEWIDAPSGATPTLDQVTGAGETSSRDIVVNGLTIGRGNTSTNSSNTALGNSALSAVTGANNTGVGAGALQFVTSGISNTAVGAGSLDANTTGSNNTAVGEGALSNSTTGGENTIIGSGAGDAISTNSRNVFVGYNAAQFLNGGDNVAIGQAVANYVSVAGGGGDKTSGTQNVYIGTGVFSGAAYTINEMVIGYGATGNGSNTATYGNSSITKHIFTNGSLGIGTDLPTENLQIESVGSSFIYMSSGTASPATLGMKMGQSISSGAAEAEVSFDVADDLFQIKTGTAAGTRRLTIEKDSGKVSITNDFAVDTNTLYVDATNNRVGIGESSPSRILHISSSVPAVRLEDTDVSGLYHEFLATAAGEFQFSADKGNVQADSKFTFAVDGSEAMRIDSSGNVLINNQSTYGDKLVVKSGNYDGTVGSAAIRVYTGAGTGVDTYHGAVAFAAGTGAAAISAVQTGSDSDQVGLSFWTHESSTGSAASTEAMRIDSNGRVGIDCSPAYKLEINHTGTDVNALVINDKSTPASTTGLYMRSTTEGRISVGSGAAMTFYNGGSSGTERMRIESDGNIDLRASNRGVYLSNVAEALGSSLTGNLRFQPSADGTVDLGFGTARWEEVFSVNGTINTSDANEKQQIESLDEAELKVATRIKGLIRKFKWNTAVEEKGENARIHVGVIAQDVKAAFESEGLDAHRYSLFTEDVWWEKEVVEINSEGVETTKTEIFEEYEEGATERTRLGVRYTELLAFVISAL